MARILMLTPQPPYPPRQGTSLRNWHLLRALSELHQVALLTFIEEDHPGGIETLSLHAEVLAVVPSGNRSATTRIRQVFSQSLPDMALRLDSPEFAKELTKAIATGGYDAVQIEGIELARYIELIRAIQPRIPIVLDCHNAETELQHRAYLNDLQSLSRWPAAAYSWIQTRRLAKFEKWACLSADTNIAVSEADRRHLLNLTGVTAPPIHVITNTLDITTYHWDKSLMPEQRFDLVFTGKMDYRPNVDGVLWFADEVWPQVRKRFPEVTWAIVGQKPHERLNRLRRVPGVTITGPVEYTQPYLAGAKVYIMPLRIGSGTRLKLIEAMTAGKAIVSTSVGAEGFPVQNGETIMLADEPDTMARAVIDLLENVTLRESLGAKAKAFSAAYDWRATVPQLANLYDELLQ